MWYYSNTIQIIYSQMLFVPCRNFESNHRRPSSNCPESEVVGEAGEARKFSLEKERGNSSLKHKQTELDIEEKILRRREMAHLFQWYYPEGGWGWVILICAIFGE